MTLMAAVLGAGVLAGPATAGETPKYGGILTYMIPGGRTAKLRRPPRRDLCDGPLGSALLQRVDPSQPGKPVVNHGFRLRPVHGDAAADR